MRNIRGDDPREVVLFGRGKPLSVAAAKDSGNKAI